VAIWCFWDSFSEILGGSISVAGISDCDGTGLGAVLQADSPKKLHKMIIVAMDYTFETMCIE